MTPGTAKAKGRETENVIVEYLRQWSPLIERRRLNGSDDQGDIAGLPGVCIEVKSGAKLSIPKWLSELEAEVKNSHAVWGTILCRLKGRPRAEDYIAILPVGTLVQLMIEAGWLAPGAHSPNRSRRLLAPVVVAASLAYHSVGVAPGS